MVDSSVGVSSGSSVIVCVVFFSGMYECVSVYVNVNVIGMMIIVMSVLIVSECSIECSMLLFFRYLMKLCVLMKCLFVLMKYFCMMSVSGSSRNSDISVVIVISVSCVR